ncbi:hypothetical protein POM88_034957 [Heracleum sosnowskyi]|uniref:Uncharacterized protein n=1 Tax=Heracleum sosnowskyi TaxID=360622 RepID=A0AAD8MB34_9APIA|nr:hypothetical protein POM88_034957 [Heracleum sosnowskyi]
MPSGAKKRRIAKKKKGLQALSSSPNSSVQSQGSDDVQHFADKESDDGSPASQEHCYSEHPFAEVDDKDVEGRVESLSGQLAVSEQSSQEVGVDSGKNVTTEEGIVQIEWELNSEEDYGSKEGSVESKEVHTGGSLGSSSSSSRRSSNGSLSSSDDGSHVKKTEVVETGHAVDTLSKAEKQVDTSISAGENSNVVSETASVVTPDKASFIEDVLQLNESSFGNYSGTPVDDILEVQEVGYKLEVQEGADKILPDKENSAGNSPILMDLGLRKVDGKAVSTSEKKAAVPVEVNNSATESKDVKLLLSFDSPTVHASKDADHVKASDSPKCSESQPLVASAPQAMQKTSLKSCCGIFELFTSSDR